MNPLKLTISKYINWLIPVTGSIVIIIMLVIIFLMKSTINTLEKSNQLQLTKIGELHRTVMTNNQTIQALNQKNNSNQDSLILLHQQNEQSKTLIDQQAKQLTRLSNENEQLKFWTNTTLPDDIIRLYSRPHSITGSDHYRKFLSQSGTLSPSSQ